MMKKAVSFFLIAVLLLCVFFGCDGTGHSAASEQQTSTVGLTVESTAEPGRDPAAEIAGAELKAGRHEREEGYVNPFKTHYIDTSFAVVHMEDGIFEESALRQAANLLAADIRTVADRLGETPDKVTIYLARRMERPAFLNGHIICTPEDLASGAYREALCGACCGLPIPWKQVGLAAYVFGAADESGLADYYADESHALTASCAAVYLVPDIAEEETVEAARKTAGSITGFLMENGGLSALQSAASTAEVLPAWQATLGITAPLALPEGCEKAGAMTVEYNRSYLCTIHMDNITVRVEEGSAADTADALYQFACRLWTGLEVEFDTIRREAPGFLAHAEERFSEPITIRFTRSAAGNWTSGYSIDLAHGNAVWHELMHVLLAYRYDNKETYWLAEGLAECFSFDAVSYALQYPEVTDDEFYTDDEVLDEAEKLFLESEKNIYRFLRSQRDDRLNGLYDCGSLEYAVGICRLLLDDPFEQESTVGEVRGYGYGGMPREEDGSGLTYPEAAVMFQYLAETYGMETVLRGNLENAPLVETYGKDYPELFTDCVAYLEETYGSLLAVSD